jgi:hypothetical protein
MLLSDLTTKVGGPFILRYDHTSTSIVHRLKLLGVVPFIIALGSAKDKYALFEAFRVALRMPYAEVTNWDALDETLNDLSWVPHTSINIVLEGAESFHLRDRQSFRTLLDIVESAGPVWAEPVSDGEWWDRAAVPFRVFVDAPASKGFPYRFPNVTG